MSALDARERLLVLDLIPPYLLAGQIQRPRDLYLIHVLIARLADGPAKRKARLSDLLPRGQVGVTRSKDVTHWFGHLSIVTFMLATVMMLHHRMLRNHLPCLLACGIVLHAPSARDPPAH